MTNGAARDEATRRAVRWGDLSGHPDVSWSVAAEARLREPPDPDAVSHRVVAAFDARPDLGPIPSLAVIASGDADAAIGHMADARYTVGRPLVRVALAPGGGAENPPRVLLAAHHAALDGLGLLALLGVALGAEVRSHARGLDPALAVRRGYLATALSRAGEAVFSPGARVSPVGGIRRARGDHLIRCSWARGEDDPPGTAALVAAVARAVRGWNAANFEPARRIELSVGASLRPGASAGLEERSAYLRVAVADAHPAGVARALRSSPREPPAPAGGLTTVAAIVRPVTTALAGRMGATALVSSLGSILTPPTVESIAFFPVAHGRSGVAVGLAATSARAVLTLRCRRRDFSAGSARAFADSIVAEAKALPA